MPSDKIVIVEHQGAVAIVTMNVPARLNALGIDLMSELSQVLGVVGANAEIRAVVLRGAGRSFSGGGDLALFQAAFDEAPVTAGRMIDEFHACIRQIRDMPKPVIAALQGPIAGGGLSLAIACDFCIASEDATFLSAYTRLAINPDGGGTWSLTRLLGPRRALEFILLNEALDAHKALEWGLVNRVVSADRLDGAVAEMASRLAREPAGAIASVKRLVHLATTCSLDEQLDREKEGFVAGAATEDFRKGVSAFFARRSARFA